MKLSQLLRGHQWRQILNNPHWQTIAPLYLTKLQLKINYQRQRIFTPDGDFLDLDWVNPGVYDQPTVILFHGMEGNSSSHYAVRIMYYLQEIGWRGVVAHARGCSGEINLTLKSYHAGFTDDMQFIIETIKKITPEPLYIAGVSLNGNAMLKFLGSHPQASQLVTAAVAISTPFDLEQTSLDLDSGINKRLYVPYFLRSLLPKMQKYAEKFPEFILAPDVDSIHQFNQQYITQMYNFKTALEYYKQSSCINYLASIATPTLILQAANDPMIKPHTWPRRDQLSANVRFRGLASGGHGGFIGRQQNSREALLRLPQVMVKYYNNYK